MSCPALAKYRCNLDCEQKCNEIIPPICKVHCDSDYKIEYECSTYIENQSTPFPKCKAVINSLNCKTKCEEPMGPNCNYICKHECDHMCSKRGSCPEPQYDFKWEDEPCAKLRKIHCCRCEYWNKKKIIDKGIFIDEEENKECCRCNDYKITEINAYKAMKPLNYNDGQLELLNK